MRYLFRGWGMLAGLLLSTAAVGQSLKTEVDQVYSFKPRKLSKAEQNAKLPALDGFWLRIKADTARYLPALRQELRAAGHNPFFYFDGASLLLSCSGQPADQQLAADAIARCELADVQAREYVRLLNELARSGVNVTPAAVKVLADEQFGFFIPEHATAFSQDYCLAYLLLPQRPAQYTAELYQRFAQASPTARRSILTTLWLTGSCEADAFLDRIGSEARQPQAIRQYARQLLASTVGRAEAPALQALSEAELQRVRQTALSRFSDEAIAELAQSSRLLRQRLDCR
jgi:hypothetical protein